MGSGKAQDYAVLTLSPGPGRAEEGPQETGHLTPSRHPGSYNSGLPMKGLSDCPLTGQGSRMPLSGRQTDLLSELLLLGGGRCFLEGKSSGARPGEPAGRPLCPLVSWDSDPEAGACMWRSLPFTLCAGGAGDGS